MKGCFRDDEVRRDQDRGSVLADIRRSAARLFQRQASPWSIVAEGGSHMPCLSPGRRRAQVQQVMIIAVGDHARPSSKEKGRWTACMRLPDSLRTAALNLCFVGVRYRAA
jgi:hypothetical protein